MSNEPDTRARMIWMLAGTGLLVGGIAAFKAYQGRASALGGPGLGEPPQVVTVQELRHEEWQPTLKAVGSLRAVRGADLAFEVAGVVAQVDVVPGADVAQGQVIATLRSEAEEAQLRQLQAQAALAELNFGRAKGQLAAGILSQADFDALAADAQVKRAAVQQQAAVLDRKRLRAPFPGRAGIVPVSPGAYIGAGTPVVTLQQLDPIHADFFLPQREMERIRTGQKLQLQLDAFPQEAFTGRVTAVNPKVEHGTRNVQVEATLPNPGKRLAPGMFATIVLETGQPERHLTLPQTALTYNPYGTTVFIAKTAPGKGGEALVAEQVFVTPGPVRGDQVAILQGLQPGLRVVTSGGLKLRNGTPLIVNNQVQPSNDPRPLPRDP